MGFSYVFHTTKLDVSLFYDRKAVEETYLPECKELLEISLERVDQVCIFDWRVRLVAGLLAAKRKFY